jgi:uncharacterized damage-inducible protein DinB
MQTMFRYNWLVREEWYRLCEDVPDEELLRIRTGGVGGILHTLFHIIDVEWSWIQSLQGKSGFQESFESYRGLEQVRKLDAAFRPEVEEFVQSWDVSMDTRPFCDPEMDIKMAVESWGEVMRHAIAHEIHHIGQLSVWSREVGKKPVSADLLGKGLISPQF